VSKTIFITGGGSGIVTDPVSVWAPATRTAQSTEPLGIAPRRTWVTAVRIRSSSEAEVVADLIVGFNAFKERFTSRVTKERPSHICVDYIEGPLKYLKNEWRFDPAPDGGTNVHFSVDFAFKSRLFEALAGQMFDRALRRMTGAFEQRAAALYGISRSSAQSAA